MKRGFFGYGVIVLAAIYLLIGAALILAVAVLAVAGTVDWVRLALFATTALAVLATSRYVIRTEFGS